MHPKDISISDFTYRLPEGKIAKYPFIPRDQSKLLIYREGKIKEDIYKNISGYISADSLLIFNNTKVIAARILFKKESGGAIEIFCLEPAGEVNDYPSVMNKTASIEWKCMIGGATKWKGGTLTKKIAIKNKIIILCATRKQKLIDSYSVEFTWQPAHFSFAEIINKAGEVPLPPYIKRELEQKDKQTYQTIYARHQGSVAAPTAGLHFTARIFSSLKKKNIQTEYVTLHIGAGTFKPVKSSTMELHEMHAEWIDVSLSSIENIRDHGAKNIIPVGTTSLRTVESLYWMGVKCYLNRNCSLEELEIKQWEVYEEPLISADVNPKTALHSLVEWLKTNNQKRLFIKTQILLAPGYRFSVATSLITNFHQPKSTLLLLVAAITKDWKEIYSFALENDFRFLSYGDGCLLFL